MLRKCGEMNHQHEGWRKKQSLSATEVTPPFSALYKLKKLTLQKRHIDTGRAQSLAETGLYCMSAHFCLTWFSFPHIAQIVQLLTALNERDCPLTVWILVMQAHGIWFFSPPSLISLTPFPKIVQAFAYLQCDYSCVWINTLCSIYRWASVICCCDETKSAICGKCGEEIHSYYHFATKLLVHSLHTRQWSSNFWNIIIFPV